jgi:serpin B
MHTNPKALTVTLSLLAAVAVAGMSGCGTGAHQADGASGGQRGASLSLVASMSPVAAPTGGPRAAVASDEQGFALNLLRRLGTGSPNLVLSPSSIATLLAMLEPGAAGATQSGIAQTLQSSGLSAGQQAQGWDALDAAISGQVTQDHIVLDSANQAWFQSGLPVRPSYLGLLAADFQTGVHEADLHGDPSGAAQAIDAWVASHTGGHIGHLLSPSQLQDVVAVLVDAVYMKASWETPFDAGRTAPALFHVSSSTTVQVPTMQTPDLFEAAAEASASLDAAELPSQGDDFSALVLMPPLGQLATFEKELTPARLNAIVAGLKSQPASVRMPRFSVSSALTLNGVLSAMGMSQAFTNAADFSNLSPRSLQLSFVVHDAQMKVNENGTEASAASGAGIEPTAATPRPPLSLDFNHPFLFLVRNNSTGLIIFEIQLTNPS